MNAAEFVASLGAAAKPTQKGRGYMVRCPAHDDKNPSLSVDTSPDGKLLLHCFAGCNYDAIMAAAGRPRQAAFPPKPSPPTPKKIVATYQYTDAGGKLRFEVVRFEPKGFAQRQPDGGRWRWDLQGVEPVLFRLPEISAAIWRGSPILIPEGEKDVLRLVKAGFEATCNAGGAGKWRDTYSDSLAGADCYVVPDNDKPGLDHAADVAASLRGKAASVRIVRLPDEMNGRKIKDASDFFDAGGTGVDLMAISGPPEPSSQPEPADLPGNDDPPEPGDGLPPQDAPGASQAAPSAEAADIRGDIVATLTDKELSLPEKRRIIGESVVNALAQRGRFFFHADLRDFGSAMFFDGERKRLERIRGDAFTAWLSDWLRVNRADQSFTFIRAAVETAAMSGPHTQGIRPEAFWASRPDAIYLSNGDGRLVKISADGVTLADNGTDGVLFPVGRTLAPWNLVQPQDAFETCSLFRDAHCGAAHGPDLLRLWLYSLPTNPRSKPPLCLAGEIGSGKTRLAKGIAELYGLPFLAAKVEENAEANFWPSIDQGGLFTLDNADTRCHWLADALANAATDGCSQRRRLYTDAETVTLRARAWIAVTTANPTFASDAGLADRLLLLRLARRDGETSDTKLTDQILAARDGALSHVADTLRKALADNSPTPGGLNWRHPDFAAFAVKVGRALGREAECVAALQQAEADKSVFCLENDPVAAALLAYLRVAGTFTGTAAELGPKLCEADPTLNEPRPLNPRRLGKRLSALWPHLERSLATAKKQTDRKGFSVFEFKSAEFAEFERPISPKPPTRESL